MQNCPECHFHRKAPIRAILRQKTITNQLRPRAFWTTASPGARAEFGVDQAERATANHDEQAGATAHFLPEGSDSAILGGVVPEVGALAFKEEGAVISQTPAVFSPARSQQLTRARATPT